LKRTQFLKGITQLSDEGSIQVFKKHNIGIEELIIGVVGVLQFEVLDYRLKNEYGVDVLIERQSYRYVRWIHMDNFNPSSFSVPMDSQLVVDKKDHPVILFKNDWSIKHAEERNKGAVLKETSI
jgi:peptide chain release factor 3